MVVSEFCGGVLRGVLLIGDFTINYYLSLYKSEEKYL